MTKKKKSGKTQSASPGPASGQPPAKARTSAGTPASEKDDAPNVARPASGPRPNSTSSPISRYVSFGLLLGVIVLVGIVFYEVMAQFLIPLFLAALLVVVFRPLHRWFHEKCGGRENLSALLTTASVLLSVLVPIAFLLFMAAAEGRHLYSQFNATKIIDGVHQIRTNLKLDMPSKSELRTIEAELAVLQQSIRLSPAEEYSHRTALYEIEKAGEKLAAEQGLPWPDKSEAEAKTPEDASDWVLFATNVLRARTLHDRIPWNADKTADGEQEFNNNVDEYRSELNQMSEYFLQFQTQLLGGKTKAWAIELVNPSDVEVEEYVRSSVAFLRDKLFRLTGAGVSYVGNLLIGTAIMVIGLYFFLLDGPKMIETFKGLSPIDDDHEQELVTEFGRVSRAVVLATLLSALAQGLLAGIGFYFAGLDSVFLLTVVSAMLAMVPFVGAAAVWIPCCLYLYFVENNLTAAIGLAIYGGAIISMADNVIKPFVLHGQSNIHPLFALLSVLGGVSTLGPIGIVIGPMLVAFLQTLLKILRSEMTDLDQLGQTSP